MYQVYHYNYSLKHIILGEPMQWFEKCRIKHLPTRRYLAVTVTDTIYEVRVLVLLNTLVCMGTAIEKKLIS